MQIKNKTTGIVSEFKDVFPWTSDPNSEWLDSVGYEFYTPDPVPKSLLAYAQEASERIASGFRNAIQNGSVISQSQPGFDIDVRRNDRDNDIDNINGMLDLLAAGLVTSPVDWVGVSETRTVSTAELQVLKIEMLAYGALVYQKKHSLEYQLAQCTTIEEYEAIVW